MDQLFSNIRKYIPIKQVIAISELTDSDAARGILVLKNVPIVILINTRTLKSSRIQESQKELQVNQILLLSFNWVDTIHVSIKWQLIMINQQ